MKKGKKEKNRGLDLGGLGARRGKKKGLGKGIGSGEGRERGAGGRGVGR